MTDPYLTQTRQFLERTHQVAWDFPQLLTFPGADNLLFIGRFPYGGRLQLGFLSWADGAPGQDTTLSYTAVAVREDTPLTPLALDVPFTWAGHGDTQVPHYTHVLDYPVPLPPQTTAYVVINRLTDPLPHFDIQLSVWRVA